MDLFVETNLAGETGPTGVTVGEAKKKKMILREKWI
jgi:hypothetical protein